jgi:U3 small nucleolar ribonucleoprotein protein IMP3
MYELYVRHALTSYANVLGKLHDMGILGTGGGGYVVAYIWNRLETNSNGSRGKLSDIEHKVTVSAFARRRLAVVMTRLRMSDHVQAAVDLIEQGHVRVGTDVVTDPAYLVTRNMEDFVTWVDSSKIKRNIMKYRDKLDDFELEAL